MSGDPAGPGVGNGHAAKKQPGGKNGMIITKPEQDMEVEHCTCLTRKQGGAAGDWKRFVFFQKDIRQGPVEDFRFDICDFSHRTVPP